MILELLTTTCNSLEKAEIKYMISGSIALNIYTIPRMTRDIDIVIELEESRVDEFVAMFPDSYYNKETIKSEIRKQGMFNIIDHKTGFKVDFILRKNTEYFNLAFSRRKRIKELNTEIWVISLEDLIISKIIWIQDLQSEKQIDDIKGLMLNTDKDESYINFWINKLNLKTFNVFENE